MKGTIHRVLTNVHTYVTNTPINMQNISNNPEKFPPTT